MKVSSLFITVIVGLFLAACSSKQQEVAHTEHSPSIKMETVALVQTPGAFENGNITLKEGAYHFTVENKGAGKDVGLVIAPKKEEITEEDHIKTAYVQELVKEGAVVSSKGDVVLTKGEYVYFCPLNPTPQYTITVE